LKRTRYPGGVAGVCSNLPVQRHRVFPHREREAQRHAVKKRLVEAQGGSQRGVQLRAVAGATRQHVNSDSGGAQRAHRLPPEVGQGVQEAENDTRHAGCAERLHALALPPARLLHGLQIQVRCRESGGLQRGMATEAGSPVPPSAALPASAAACTSACAPPCPACASGETKRCDGEERAWNASATTAPLESASTQPASCEGARKFAHRCSAPDFGCGAYRPASESATSAARSRKGAAADSTCPASARGALTAACNRPRRRLRGKLWGSTAGRCAAAISSGAAHCNDVDPGHPV